MSKLKDKTNKRKPSLGISEIKIPIFPLSNTQPDIFSLLQPLHNSLNYTVTADYAPNISDYLIYTNITDSKESNLEVNKLIFKRLKELYDDLDEDQYKAKFLACEETVRRFLEELPLAKKPLIGATDNSTITLEWRNQSNGEIESFIHINDNLIHLNIISPNGNIILKFDINDWNQKFPFYNCVKTYINALK